MSMHFPPFHGDNTGSNPVGDANKIKELHPNIPTDSLGASSAQVVLLHFQVADDHLKPIQLDAL
jgi:hypothetical protein